ncbi:hypothetical protein CEXT_98841 [Caerostris extrusa]|uniref:Uncharacterized protein n=1 Tax=Caerostris extrusa TaxID=172846 RepID=A0AAV4TPY3_CAEEX|nr:hypothetical protein CEXT_98841 [Caerostris extrusa]
MEKGTPVSKNSTEDFQKLPNNFSSSGSHQLYFRELSFPFSRNSFFPNLCLLENLLFHSKSILTLWMTSRWRCYTHRSIFHEATTTQTILVTEKRSLDGPCEVQPHHTGRSRLKCPPFSE